MKKTISILGSTGSIGVSAISLLQNELREYFEVEALSFYNNAELAIKQAQNVNAKFIVTTSKEGYEKALKISSNVKIKYGKEILNEVCQNPKTNVILLAIMGAEGLQYALNSIIPVKRTIAIANKESIICGFHLIKEKLNKYENKCTILPVDSEHNSLFRLLKNTKPESVESAFITASGGPFVGKEFHSLHSVSLKEVIKHPIWNMGEKISIDSASMANKGLELIECYKLFDLQAKTIEAFITRGSKLHAGVNFWDGSSQWFLASPDMKNHISHAILEGKTIKLDLPKIKTTKIEFEEIKKTEFPIFYIAKDIAESKSIESAISFNMLNEIAVEMFIKGKIKYTQILEIIEKHLNYNPYNFKFNSLEEIMEIYSILKAKITNY